MIDMKLTYQTRDGRPVRLLCTDGPDKAHPVMGITDGNNFVNTWYADGLFYPGRAHEYDLIEVKPKVIVERWVNIWEGISLGNVYVTIHDSVHTAMSYNGVCDRALARAIPFKWVEGEGV